MQDPTCKFCGEKALFTFSAYPNSDYRSPRDSVYKFHIGVRCVQCDKWCGWVQQTPEIIEYLSGAVFVPRSQHSNPLTKFQNANS